MRSILIKIGALYLGMALTFFLFWSDWTITDPHHYRFLSIIVFYFALGLMSFFIRCDHCGKPVFVREFFGESVVVPVPNRVCTRCCKRLF
jgi:hypothetical protein